MIKVGELSGNLDKSLEYLSIQLHREADLKNKLWGDDLSFGHCGGHVDYRRADGNFVLPQLTSVFKDFGSSLPVSTKMVIWFADFMSGNAVLVIGLMIAFIAGAIAIYRTYREKSF